ncbi:hypothetical protein J2X98_004069 [Pseudarthrobacter enclensis]|uniref:Uncharacterized protein n=1 Tax=Pseudarthrobacter enclensis TaxID=993070 RepID=A0ABT9S0C2_9MICC|nr:hypothetical protein [Pseudarthrobacter enclensis]
MRNPKQFASGTKHSGMKIVDIVHTIRGGQLSNSAGRLQIEFHTPITCNSNNGAGQRFHPDGTAISPTPTAN